MTALHDPELIKALAAWVGQLKSPYHEDRAQNTQPVRLMSSSPNAWLEINQCSNGKMEITCIHRLIEQTEKSSLAAIRKECHQFNALMERIRLPAYMWEDRSRAEFQLRWQETLANQADLSYVQRLFEQSLYLANALQGRLGWALNQRTQPYTH